MRSLKVLSIAVAALLGGFAGAVVSAQQPANQQTYFTFSGPVSLPGVTLPAGRYEFKLANSLVDRQIVQIYSGDGSKLFATLFAIRAERADIPENAQISFLETPADQPPAIQAWWYPGIRSGGHEFIYSRKQAQQFAKAGAKGVLTAQGDEKTGGLARVAPSGEETKVAATETTPQSVGRTQQGDVNPEPSATIARNSAATPAKRTSLPHTASAVLVVAWMGFVSLAAGAALTLRRRRQHA